MGSPCPVTLLYYSTRGASGTGKDARTVGGNDPTPAYGNSNTVEFHYRVYQNLYLPYIPSLVCSAVYSVYTTV